MMLVRLDNRLHEYHNEDHSIITEKNHKIKNFYVVIKKTCDIFPAKSYEDIHYPTASTKDSFTFTVSDRQHLGENNLVYYTVNGRKAEAMNKIRACINNLYRSFKDDEDLTYEFRLMSFAEFCTLDATVRLNKLIRTVNHELGFMAFSKANGKKIVEDTTIVEAIANLRDNLTYSPNLID